MPAKETPPKPAGRAVPPAAAPLLIAVVATVAVLATLGPQGQGPGVTCDELYHVNEGKELLTALRHQGLRFFAMENVRRNFRWAEDGPPAHPPLGNWVLGVTHHLFDPAPDNPAVLSIAAARFAPAGAFGLMVALVGLSVLRSDGPLAGGVSAAAVALMPRLFGHAHLAALDTLTALLFVAAVLAVVEADRRGGRIGWFALAGFIWGLAMLVRFHGLLVLPPVVAWMIWRMRARAVLPIVAWAATGLATFVAGWPWLWYHPAAHLRQYLATAASRATLNVFYAGQVWSDREVPWHYTPAMVAVTVPLGFLVLGLLGGWAKRRAWKTDPGSLLVIGTLVWVIVVFAAPCTPVYDGVRLFIMVFPLGAVFVGAGAQWVVRQPIWRRAPAWAATASVAGLVALQSAGLIASHPYTLGHYNLLAGGPPGAETLGFEVTYWGDTVREPMLERAARASGGKPILFLPNLAPFQAPAVGISSPALIEHETRLVGWDPNHPRRAAACRLAIVYHRRADLDPNEPLLRGSKVVQESRNQGVWVARLVELAAPVSQLIEGNRARGSAPRHDPSSMGPRRTGSID